MAPLYARTGLVVAALLVAASAARADAEGPVALVVNTDDPAFSWARVQRSVAEATDAPVVATDDPSAGTRRGLLTVTWRPSRRELAVTYENKRGVISRILPAPDDVGGAVAAAGVLAANLVRDQAAELLGGDEAVGAPPPPPEAPPPATARRRPAPSVAAPPTEVVDAAPPPPERLTSRWMIGVSVGTGIGWGTGDTETARVTVASGLALTGLGHIQPEVGFFLRPRLMLSAALRAQYIAGLSELRNISDAQSICGTDIACTSPRWAFMGLARATLFAAPQQRDLRPYVSAALGLGVIRYPVSVSVVDTCGSKGDAPCVDTLKNGPVFVGVGAGVRYRVADAFDLVAGLDLLLTPDPRFNLDANVGGAISF